MRSAAEIDRIRTRAFYLSLDESRAGTADHERDWLDAEIAEDEALLSVLDGLPKLRAALERAPAFPNLVHAGALLRAIRDGQPAGALTALDRAIAGLSSRFSAVELKPYLDDLIVTTDPVEAEARWDRAVTDLCALDALNRQKCLGALGWAAPGSSAKPSAPAFRCSVAMSGVLIPCDLAPLLGSGFRLARQEVTRLVSAWAREHGLDDVEAQLSCRGATPATMASTTEAELAAFERQLGALTDVPTGPLGLRVGATLFDVFVARPGNVGPASAAGVAPPSALVSSQLPTFKRHIEELAKAASAVSGPAPFLLGRVLAGGASDCPRRFEDLAKKASSGAMNLANSAGSLWLGAVVFDVVEAEVPAITLHVRPAADWPGPYRTLAAALGATVAIL